MERAQVLWQCDDCGGPAVWTIIRGEVYYHCEQQCDGFMQMELFEDPKGMPGMTGGGAATTRAPNQDKELPF